MNLAAVAVTPPLLSLAVAVTLPLFAGCVPDTVVQLSLGGLGFKGTGGCHVSATATSAASQGAKTGSFEVLLFVRLVVLG